MNRKFSWEGRQVNTKWTVVNFLKRMKRMIEDDGGGTFFMVGSQGGLPGEGNI